MAQELLCPNIDRKSLIPKKLNYLIVNLVQIVLITVFLFLLQSVRTLYDITAEEWDGKCVILSTKKQNKGATKKSERKNERNKSVYQHIAYSQKDTESNNQEDIETKIKQKQTQIDKQTGRQIQR